MGVLKPGSCVFIELRLVLAFVGCLVEVVQDLTLYVLVGVLVAIVSDDKSI